MAQVLARTAKVEPDVELDQALQDYEAILTDEQKIQMRSSTGIPSATAAITLTIDIDRENSSRRSRCVGARLMTLLESVQQFTTVIDTFVSSNPHMAGLIWGGVKVALLAVNNFSSYFDKLSTLFMKIGSSCPRFADFGLLYPNSTGLQKALCDYYAVVIRLCTQAIVFSRKSEGIAQLSKTFIVPFEAKFGNFQKDLERLGQVVRDEICLASQRIQIEEAKLQIIERQDASVFRTRFKDKTRNEYSEAREWRLQADSRESKRRRLQFLSGLSTYNHLTAWKQARRNWLSGTAGWMISRPEFIEWSSVPCSSSLWCTGILGAGKTIISANVAAHLLATVSPKDSVACFFCRYDDATSLLSRTIMGSISKQLLTRLPLESLLESDEYSNDIPPDTDKIVEILGMALPKTQKYFVIIDGLDECEEAEAEMVISALQSLLALPTVSFKLYLSSRPDMYQWSSRKLRIDWHVSMTLKDVDPDIRNFVDATLERCIEEDKLQLGDPYLISTLQDALVKGAQGMFLWVTFQIETLCSQRSDDDILRTLGDLPKSLPETFDRILGKLVHMKDTDVRNGIKVFQWLAVARQPLTLEQLREVISIKPLQENMASESLINNVANLLIGCGSLVTVNEEELTVHFVHHSIKQYLLSAVNDPLLQRYHFDFQTIDLEAGEICVTYLSFKELTTQVSNIPAHDANDSRIPSAILKETLAPYARQASRIALKLLKDRRNTNYSLYQNLREVAGVTESHCFRQARSHYLFLPYAREFWLLHTRYIRQDQDKIWRIWCRLIDDDSITKPWPMYRSGFWTSGLLEWIIHNDHPALLQYWIRRVPNLKFGWPLDTHAEVRATVKSLIARRKMGLLQAFAQSCSIDTGTSWVINELRVVLAGLGDPDLFRLVSNLIKSYQHRTIPSTTLEQYGMGCTCFDQAHPIIFFIPAKTIPRSWSALMVAAAFGQEQIFSEILASYVPYNNVHHEIMEALAQAAIHDHTQIADSIIDHALAQDIDLNELISTKCRDQWTPLMYIVSMGDLTMVKKMVEMGRNVYVNGGKGYNHYKALDIAIRLKHVPIISYLREKGAKVWVHEPDLFFISQMNAIHGA